MLKLIGCLVAVKQTTLICLSILWSTILFSAVYVWEEME